MEQAQFLTGHRALVTGASRGLGLAMASELAALGAELVLVARNAAGLEQARAQLSASGAVVTAVAADVCETHWLDELLASQAPISILVHAAAAYLPYGAHDQADEESINRVVDVNLTAALRIAARLLPGMKAARYGAFIFVGSRVAELGAAGQVSYASAKAGLKGLVKSLAVENARHGIRAHLLELGLFDTERTQEAMGEDRRRQLAEATPAGRMGLPGEAAAALRFLLSDDAAFMCGSTLTLDGGIGLGLPRRAKD